MITPSKPSSGDVRPIVYGQYRLELFNTALDATKYIRRIKKETGSRPRSWKVVSGEHAGKYSVEYWFGKNEAI